MSRLGEKISTAVKQNNTIDIYENYFSEPLPDHSSEPPAAKGLAVFRDPSPISRTATCIDWHPGTHLEGRIAVAYSVLRFQDPRLMSKVMSMDSYLWDIQKPNTPESTLKVNSPLCSIKFNPKNPDQLVGGCYNGVVTLFDRRKSGGKAHSSSKIEKSHYDPVFDIHWVQSKTGTQCASCSTDGRVIWWDTRKLVDPEKVVSLARNGDESNLLGASCMAYNAEAGPTKYLLGTEQGVVANINTRSKKTKDGVSFFTDGPGRHHSPIYSIERNPVHSKYFMTVGDWTARIWTDDLKTPIMTTKYHGSYLTGGCWSPTRPGVFFVTRMDGVVDIWDYFYRQNEIALTHKVCDAPLSSISIHNKGKLVAVGDDHGTVSLLEVSDSLAKGNANEKLAMHGMFERETQRERNLMVLARDSSRQKKNEASITGSSNAKTDDDSTVEEMLMNIDKKFLELVKEDEN